MLKDKVRYALKNNLKVVFCIGENKSEKKNKKTLSVLKRQLTKVLEKKFNKNNIIVAYEPIWSIGTGKIPTAHELKKTTFKLFFKAYLTLSLSIVSVSPSPLLSECPTKVYLAPTLLSM